jgi:hypothetical protein
MRVSKKAVVSYDRGLFVYFLLRRLFFILFPFPPGIEKLLGDFQSIRRCVPNRNIYLKINAPILIEHRCPRRHSLPISNTNTNTNNLFPPIPSDTIMFIYDNFDNKYDNTISYSCLLFKK